jgi:hypothetical protein
MSKAHYPEIRIRSIMNFTGFTRQEAVDYLHDLIKIESKMKYHEEQESKMLDQLYKNR